MKKMNPEFLFSIVVPTFNRLKVLERSVGSVINQSYSNWELIIVDDGSTDDTVEKAAIFEKEDSRIQFFQRPNSLTKGANTCRNLGINKAKGDYIAFLDSDDFWQPNRLTNLSEFILSTQAKAIYSGASVITENGIEYRKSRAIYSEESIFDFLLDYETYSQTSSMVVYNDISKNLKFNESLQRHQDFDFFIRVGELTAWSFFESNDILVYNDQSKKKVIDFTSCVDFYELHKHKSLKKEKRIGYLNYISESCAKVNPNRKVLDYYKNEFMQENVQLTLRQKFIFRFPYVFQFFFKIKSFIKSN